VLVFRWKPVKWVSWLAALMIWIFIALITMIFFIVHRKEGFYGNVKYCKLCILEHSIPFHGFDIYLKGCWVTPVFEDEQLVSEYTWLWICMSLVVILYAIMFTVMRGWVIVENGVWYWYKNYTGRPMEETPEETDSKAMARLLLL
jgi:hypothetical protein